MHLLSGCDIQGYLSFCAAATVEAALQLGFVLYNPGLTACMAACFKPFPIPNQLG